MAKRIFSKTFSAEEVANILQNDEDISFSIGLSVSNFDSDSSFHKEIPPTAQSKSESDEKNVVEEWEEDEFDEPITPIPPIEQDRDKENNVQRPEENENDENDYERIPLGISKQRKRNRKPNPSNWIVNINKKKRALGEKYDGRKLDTKSNKWNMVKRSERKRGPRCTRDSCSKNARQCRDFTDEECDSIFKEFWGSGDPGKQKTFIQALVDVKDIARKTISPTRQSRRQTTKVYRLKKDGVSQKVCKDMFLNVLGITKWKVNSALENSPLGISKEVTKPRNPNPSRGFKWTQADQDLLADFFKLIPKAPSHYCRQETSKIFLDCIIPTMEKLHAVYKARCIAMGSIPFSIFKVTEYFKDHNYSLFQRKKDKCNTCVGYETGNVPPPVYYEHVIRKNKGFVLKEKDKEEANNKDKFVITADTEALLIAPLNNANIMFFRTKLNLHNFTFYNLKDKSVQNYLWTESNGDLDASSFASCFLDYINKIVNTHPEVKTIILWTDGCTYQNRNNVLASTIANFAKKNRITVYQKYLEVGHTHMECDSVHRCIENAKKNVSEINLPTDYQQLIRSARKRPSGYGVKYLDYTFFKDYKSICDVKSIKPTKEAGVPYVVDIRQIKYTSDGIIYTNLTYDDDSWKILPIKVNLRSLTAKQTRDSPIPIPYSKWQHLQEIKETIPRDCHSFYDNLPHLPNPKE